MEYGARITSNKTARPRRSLMFSEKANRAKRIGSFVGHAFLFTITSSAALAVLFIFYFIGKDALPFFKLYSLKDFFVSTQWFPTQDPPVFGALAIFYGSAIVTLGAILVAVPLGVLAAVCLSDVLPFKIRQLVKPVIEILAAIPSVAYGFFALVIFAPILQEKGGGFLSVMVWIIGVPTFGVMVFLLSEIISSKTQSNMASIVQILSGSVLSIFSLLFLWVLSKKAAGIEISSGTNAFNVSIILGLMALPTVVSVAEDALQAVGRELREGALALGATRAETVMRVVIPAASSGIYAAIILGVMRAIGETMVVWMASGNAAQIASPWYNLFEPVRTLTATIAGDMGEADQVTGSTRYHVLFALALFLLIFSFVSNIISEWISSRSRVKLEY